MTIRQSFSRATYYGFVEEENAKRVPKQHVANTPAALQILHPAVALKAAA
jgi:hypothetical protein